MATNGLNRKKVDKELYDLKERARKVIEKPKEDNKFLNDKHREDIGDYYNNITKSQKIALHRALTFKQARENYAKYVKFVHPEYVFTKFHALLCNIAQSVVEKIENGQKIKICISCPPQHGKSISITETLPSWFIGRNPDLRCIITAYNADVAEKFGNKNRQLVKQFGKDNY